MTRHAFFALVLLAVAAIALFAGRAQAVDRNFAGIVLRSKEDRLRERAGCGDVREGAKRFIPGFDAVEGRLRDLARARGAGSDRLDDGLSGSIQEHRRHGVNTGAGSSSSSSGIERSFFAWSAAMRK